MADLREVRSTQEEERLNGRPPKNEDTADSLAELRRLIDDIRTLGGRLVTDFSALAQAQWRLTSYVMAGSARIFALRAVALAITGILGVAIWVLVNVTVWQAIAEVDTYAFVQPLALVVLNSIVALSLFIWQKGLRLT